MADDGSSEREKNVNEAAENSNFKVNTFLFFAFISDLGIVLTICFVVIVVVTVSSSLSVCAHLDYILFSHNLSIAAAKRLPYIHMYIYIFMYADCVREYVIVYTMHTFLKKER